LTGIDYIGEPTPYEWPAKAGTGAIDTANFPKDVFYFYQSAECERAHHGRTVR
jgi:beta-galactosidase